MTITAAARRAVAAGVLRARHPRRVFAVTLLAVSVAATGCGTAGTAAPTVTSETSERVATVSTALAATSGTTGPAEDPSTSITAASSSTTAPPDTTPPTRPGGPLLGLALETVTDDVHQPTAVASPVGDDRLFVVEREGRVRVIDPDEGLVEEPFLDLEDRVQSSGIEQGMLGLAFHPGFAENGRVFVYYVESGGQRRLSELHVAGAAQNPEAGDERVLLELPQPPGSVDTRHYGGMLVFGPDGYLWASLGDGADFAQGQDPGSLYGTIIRIDVDTAGEPYGVPGDNPFVTGGGAAEVWAYGLRNPWRFTIDPVDRLVYIADVGQEDWEEVDIVPMDSPGANFGWPDSEGARCFLVSDCDLDAFTLPAAEYDHDEGCSIIGGHVYRGRAIPELAGHYFFGDWCGMWVRSFRYAAGGVTDEVDWSADLAGAGQINAFGVDGAGELYIANFAGTVARIVPVR